MIATLDEAIIMRQREINLEIIREADESFPECMCGDYITHIMAAVKEKWDEIVRSN